MNIKDVFEQAKQEARRADACADCKYVAVKETGEAQCTAFFRLCTYVRAEHKLHCPAYVRKAPPTLVIKKPKVGALRRFFGTLWRWIW